MPFGDLQNNRSFARRFICTFLSTKMEITLLRSTATQEADCFRESGFMTVNIQYSSMSKPYF
jgi:hypothetical protein